MALRDKVALRAIGYTLTGLAILSFAVYLVSKQMAGQSAETYYSGTMVRWNYGAALAFFAALAFAAVVAGVIRIASWFMTQREIARLAEARGGAERSQGVLDSTPSNTSVERTREG